MVHEIHLELVDSTNTYAQKHCGAFPKNQITCVTAEEQSAGRGRYQRRWISPRGVNLYATFYFSLPLHTAHLISLSQVMAHSLAQLLIAEGFDPKIKWPNDIQLNGKKVSGILTETQFGQESIDLFIGVGLNVNLDAAAAKKIDQPATSLFIETGKQWDKTALLHKLGMRFSLDLELFKQSGFSPFLKAFDRLLALKGDLIRVYDGNQEWVGVCHSINNEGQLNLLLSNGALHPIFTGDILPT